jgi:hypothetical protein
VPVATINSANVVTLFTEDGKVVHRLVYQVRNSAKQFLEIQLPEDADVWSVFVDNQPVESSINEQRKLLVPLIRSRSVNDRLDAFPVEVIYCVVEDRFSWFGSRESSLPAVDLLISQLIWSVYLPIDYSYHYFSSTLEKEEIIRGLNIFLGTQRQYDEKAMKEVSELAPGESDEMRKDILRKVYKGGDYKSQFRNVPLQEEQISSQVEAELKFGGRLEGLAEQEASRATISGGTATGVLPIQIQVPTGGQVYRFAKTIIKTEDPLTFSVIYTRLWVNSMLKWIIFLFIIFMLYLNRKRLTRPWRWLKEKLQVLINFYKNHESDVKKYAQSKMTPFVMFGLMIVFWRFSRLLTLLFFFLFWVGAIYQILNYRKKKTQAKAKSERQTEELDASD